VVRSIVLQQGAAKGQTIRVSLPEWGDYTCDVILPCDVSAGGSIDVSITPPSTPSSANPPTPPTPALSPIASTAGVLSAQPGFVTIGYGFDTYHVEVNVKKDLIAMISAQCVQRHLPKEAGDAPKARGKKPLPSHKEKGPALPTAKPALFKLLQEGCPAAVPATATIAQLRQLIIDNVQGWEHLRPGSPSHGSSK
jgi:hypothetical protein